jgi:hypothetical protein
MNNTLSRSRWDGQTVRRRHNNKEVWRIFSYLHERSILFRLARLMHVTSLIFCICKSYYDNHKILLLIYSRQKKYHQKRHHTKTKACRQHSAATTTQPHLVGMPNLVEPYCLSKRSVHQHHSTDSYMLESISHRNKIIITVSCATSVHGHANRGETIGVHKRS